MVLTAQVRQSRHGVRPSDFRPDIEGMRAVAVLLVVVFHAGWVPLSGGFIGVDVFFVISGFLITRLLLAEVRREGRIFLADFWARRARRLLPASALVLVVVVAASFLLVSPLERMETGRDVTAAAGFYANWWFAQQALDYFASDRAASPVLHFWSLSVEEQYYLVWPPLLVGVLALRRRGGIHRMRSVRTAGVVLLAIGFLSFGWSLLEIRSTPVEAYYGTFARAWELAVGGLMAVLATARVALPGRLAAMVSWLGLGAIVVAAFVIDEGTPFPGVAALAPVMGAAAVLFAGNSVGLPGACRPLGARVPREIGRLSYSIYLWHWPFLVLAPYWIGELDALKSTAVVLASVVVAWATFHLVENPARRSPYLSESSKRSLLMGASLIAVGLLAGQVAARPVPGAVPGGPTNSAGASSGAIVPDPARARFDVNRIREDRCQSLFDWTEVKECLYGDTTATEKWVLWGDSHAVQWFPALEANALEAGVALQVFGKTSCPASLVTFYSRKWGRAYDECTTWRDEVYRQVQAMPPGTVVFLSGMHEYVVVEDGRVLDEASSARPIAAGQQEIARTLTALGMTVVTIRDTPFPDRDVPQCVSEHMDDPSACDFPRPPSARGRSWEERTLSGIPRVRHVDLLDEVCDRRSCPAVVDNILRWRDRDHLTATFVETLVQPLAEQLDEIGLTREPQSGTG